MNVGFFISMLFIILLNPLMVFNPSFISSFPKNVRNSVRYFLRSFSRLHVIDRFQVSTRKRSLIRVHFQNIVNYTNLIVVVQSYLLDSMQIFVTNVLTSGMDKSAGYWETHVIITFL